MFRKNLVVINWKSAVFLVLSVMLANIRITQTSVSSNNPEVIPTKLEKSSTDNDQRILTINSGNKIPSDTSHCPNETLCTDLPNSCLQCNYNAQCIYGTEMTVLCSAKLSVNCHPGDHEVKRKTICRYCYQTERWEQICEHKGGCNSIDAQYKTNCTVRPEILCMGHRTFMRKVPCNWTQGYRWSTTLILSITLGGFGVDRFFLGHWQEGIGKLFSFGGLGVWTLIDVLLISLHYLGPADGSLYI
ncbi:TM2 domain-containing protein almondex [Uranotaenia lowii]|uniref:TM2 domain-containing protein almondex n=1 Tax=Uranotaenia lowii TaxID=190385 RepID=UPI00247854ED|nr:TM2 domain-containing protein almondex [Uranotaenia lowii]